MLNCRGRFFNWTLQFRWQWLDRHTPIYSSFVLWGHPDSRRVFGTVSSSPGTHGLRCCVCRRTSGCSRCSGRPAPSQVSALFIMLTLWSVHECIGRVPAVAWTSWEQWLHSELPSGVCTDGQYLYHYLLWADVSKYVLIFSVSSTFSPLGPAQCKLCWSCRLIGEALAGTTLSGVREDPVSDLGAASVTLREALYYRTRNHALHLLTLTSQATF